MPTTARTPVLLQQRLEIGDGAHQPLLERRARRPSQHVARLGDVGLALARIVGRQRPAHDLGARSRHVDHDLGELADRELGGIADVDGAGDVVGGLHQADDAVDEIVDIAERTGLPAVAIDGDVASEQRLDDEIRDHAAVIGMHARTIGVEDARHLDAQLVLAPIIEEQGLGAALAFVVAGPGADRIDVAPILLGLRVDVGIAIDLRGRGLENLGAQPLGEPEHVDGAVHARLGGLHGVVLVVHGRRRAGEIVDLVDLDIERKRHVVTHQLEMLAADADARCCAWRR